MRNVVLIVIILAIAGFFLYLGFRSEPEPEVTDNENTEEATDETGSNNSRPEEELAVVESDLDSATVIVPDIGTQAALVDGSATFETSGGVGAASEGFARRGDAYATWNEDMFAAAHVTFGFGGTGTFDYLVVFEMTDEGLVQRDAELLGDGIVVEGINVSGAANGGAELTVRILDREEGALISAEPTVEKTLSFTVSGTGEITAN